MKIVLSLLNRIFVYGLFVLCLGSHTWAQGEQKGVNFILILTDDQGWTSTSVQMDDEMKNSRSDFYRTINIERLARMGMRFSRGYSSAAICSPSRRSIQFGQTPTRQGDLRFNTNYHPDSITHPTIPLVLKSIDPRYRTAHYGKWDMRADIYPEDLGYDESDGNTGNKNGNMNSNSITKWTEYFINSDPKKIESLTGRAINFMKRQVKSDHPFFLQISHYATHVDIQAKEETLKKYWKKDPGRIHGNPGFAAMTEDLDQSIGRIIDMVYQLGIEEHTYFIFMADNGGVELIPQTNQKMIPPSEYGRARRNFPLRGGKWTLYEGGIRIPFIVAGPGVPSGSTTDVPVAGWDILPTVADLAGFSGNWSSDIDGRSLAGLLKDPEKPGTEFRNRPLIFHRYNDHYPHSAVIIDRYKLVKHWKSELIELYDLSADIGETKNIAQSHPQAVEKMYDVLISYLQEVNAEVLDSYDP